MQEHEQYLERFRRNLSPTIDDCRETLNEWLNIDNALNSYRTRYPSIGIDLISMAKINMRSEEDLMEICLFCEHDTRPIDIGLENVRYITDLKKHMRTHALLDRKTVEKIYRELFHARKQMLERCQNMYIHE